VTTTTDDSDPNPARRTRRFEVQSHGETVTVFADEASEVAFYTDEGGSEWISAEDPADLKDWR
jgi:hypothetical protein